MTSGKQEALASLVHQMWARWMQHIFSLAEEMPDGSVKLSEASVRRWKRQIETDYAKLSDAEQDSDRLEAKRILALLQPHKPTPPRKEGV